MALFRQQCRGCGTLAAGCFVLLCLLFVAPAAGANSPREQAAERYRYAHLLLEDLHSVPVAELGEEQYQLVIEAFQKVARTSPESSRSDDALLQVGNLYREMSARFGAKAYKPKSIAAYELLVSQYPQSKLADAARKAIADIQKGVPAPKRPLDPPADDEEETVVAEATPAAAPADPAAGAAVLAEPKLVDAKEAAAKETVAPAVLAAPVPNAVATLSSRSLVIPVADKPKAGTPRKTPGRLEGVHFWSNPEYTRVVVEMDDRVELSYDTLDNPKRLFFDLLETTVSAKILDKPSREVSDAFLKKIRVAQFGKRSARIVLDLERSAYFDISWLSNPARLVVELRSADQPAMLAHNAPAAANPPAEAAKAVPPAAASTAKTKTPAKTMAAKTAPAVTTSPAASPVAGKLEAPARTPDPAVNFAHLLDRTVHPETAENSKAESAALDNSAQSDKAAPGEDPPKPAETTAEAREATATLNEAVKPETEAAITKGAEKASAKTAAAATAKSKKGAGAKTDKTTKPTQVVAKAEVEPSIEKAERIAGENASEDVAADAGAPDSEIELAKVEPPPLLNLPSPKPATANARGQRNLIRALGLKIGRVVIDAGHGGHDTGSIGGSGLREKDLVLDIALRLGKLIEEGLGSEVVYTRGDDRFISLKERTTVANERKADLFISIHANSSRSRTVRGVETYYLNFTTDSWALTVASRENAASDRPVHELQDLLSKIALKEKIEESREFATRVQTSLYDGLGDDSKNIRDRGVRKAPFMVLIGAKMPAVLAEIGFLSNPQTEKMLKTGTYRQKIANHLYQGILNYSDSLGSISMARSGSASAIE